MADTLGTVTGADFAKGWNLQREYLWEFRMPVNFEGKDGMQVCKYCQSVQFGDYNMSTVSTIRYGAFQAHYAGFLDIAKVVAVFLRPIPDIVTPFFHSWRNRIVDEQGFFGVKSDYARDIYVYFLSNDGSEVGRVTFKNAFPNVYPGYSLGYEQSSVVRLQVEFQVDRVFFE